MRVIARVYIVRHGETDANRAGILQGQMDTQLNEVGVAQARKTADALERVPFHHAYSSDLSRAVKTAEIILSMHPGVALNRNEELRERSFGDLEGQHLRAGGKAEIPANAETPASFSNRVVRWWNRVIVQEHVRSSQNQCQDAGVEDASAGSAFANSSPSLQSGRSTNILIVSHGGVIGTLAVALLGSRKLRCAQGVVVGQSMNAAISVVEMGEDGQGVLVSFGDTRHLDDGLVEVNVDEVSS